MLFRSVSLSALLLASSSAEEEHAPFLPTCPIMMDLPKYHQTCNVAWQNDPLRSHEREERHAAIRQLNAYSSIPPQRTVVCPTDSDTTALAAYQQGGGGRTLSTGLDTRWIVENKSVGRIVIGHVKSNGVECSAMNSKITPPQADPLAILQPGEFKVLQTYEGHVFNVHQLLDDGTTGDLLMQHRVGIVEFTNRYGKDLDCAAAAGGTKDEDTVDEEQDDKNDFERNEFEQDWEASSSSSVSGVQGHEAATTDTSGDTATATSKASILSKKHKRELYKGTKHCNMIYQGFRNTLPNCPLDVFYAGVEQEQSITDGPMQCAEMWKFNLGSKDGFSPEADSESSLKFESTFVGHTFVARLSSDPSVVVDSYTVKPTEIHDCPRRAPKAEAAEQVIEFHAIQNGNANLQGSNSTSAPYMEALSVVLPANSMVGVAGMSS